MTPVSGNHLYWLRRRLGGAGLPCLRIREKIRNCLPAMYKEVCVLGLSPSEIADFSKYYRLAEVAKHFIWRGDCERLEAIAWWGSALGDISSVGQPIYRSQIIWEAASFNLGIALFDSILENDSDKFPLLAQVLHGKRLKARLECSSISDQPLRCDEYSLNLVVRLFDRTLSSAGQRFSDSPSQIAYLSELLDKMYKSELGISDDLFASKTTPLVFIGALGNFHNNKNANSFFEAFGHFFHLWDDWLDLIDDFSSLAPNIFLGTPRSFISTDFFLYSIRFLTRAVGGTLFHDNIAMQLSTALAKSLSATLFWDEKAYRKTLQLCYILLQ